MFRQGCIRTRRIGVNVTIDSGKARFAASIGRNVLIAGDIDDNWGTGGAGEFDDKVFEAADSARRRLSLLQERALGDTYYNSLEYVEVLEALRSRPGGRDYVTACLITAMYHAR
jgi:hypothetical protein